MINCKFCKFTCMCIFSLDLFFFSLNLPTSTQHIAVSHHVTIFSAPTLPTYSAPTLDSYKIMLKQVNEYKKCWSYKKAHALRLIVHLLLVTDYDWLLPLWKLFMKSTVEITTFTTLCTCKWSEEKRQVVFSLQRWRGRKLPVHSGTRGWLKAFTLILVLGGNTRL